MKPIIYFPLVAACLASGPVLAAADIRNPGFEDLTGTFPAGWITSGVIAPVPGLAGTATAASLAPGAAMYQDFVHNDTGAIVFTAGFVLRIEGSGDVTTDTSRVRIRGNGNAGDLITLRLAPAGLQSFTNGFWTTAIPFVPSRGTEYAVTVNVANLNANPQLEYQIFCSGQGAPAAGSAVFGTWHTGSTTATSSTTPFQTIRFEAGAGNTLAVDQLTLTDLTPPELRNKVVNISGVYPHLAVTNSHSECGIGAVVPWQGDLWAITYGPHLANGSDDKLYQISPGLGMYVRPESTGGTPANRFIHTASNQLVIGPHFIDASKNVRTLSYGIAPGRYTATAAHLNDPNRLYIFTMENGLYDVNAGDLSVITRYPDIQGGGDDFLFGYHGKGAYTRNGRLIVANNGRHDNAEDPSGPSGVLASWDGSVRGEGDSHPQRMTAWIERDRVQHCEVTGPGGIRGNANASDPVWATGFDWKSVLLRTFENGTWTTWRLPKSSHTHDGSHGWHTEWPRIREISQDKFLMHMHGMFFDFPKSFSVANFSGLSPICSYYKMPVDYCGWDGKLVMAKNDTSKFSNNLVQRAQSNFWFGQLSDLKQWGCPQGHGSLWRQEAIAEGQTSDPFLIEGFADGTLHLRHEGGAPLPLAIEISSGTGAWETYKNVIVPAGSYYFEVLTDVPGGWLRLKAGAASSKATATLLLSNAYPHVTPASLATDRFAALADVRDGRSASDGVIRVTSGNDLGLEFAANRVDGAGTSSAAGYHRIGGPMQLEAVTDPALESSFRTNAAITKDFDSDAASAWVMLGGTRLRLPKYDPLYDAPFSSGWPRGFREVVTERALLNCHGTFYEVPRDNSGGRRKLQPIATHGKRISDFTSWRGLLVLTGVAGSAPASDTLVKSADGSALWLGEIDDLWQMGEPRGTGGPWLDTAIGAGTPSDPYLMYGYRRKVLELSHQSAAPVSFTVEVDFLADNTWSTYKTFTVQPGQTLSHLFADGFHAHWVRVSSDTATLATARFIYGPAAARDRFLDWAREGGLPTGIGRAGLVTRDDDQDGQAALIEYVLGTDPSASAPVPVAISEGEFTAVVRAGLTEDSIATVFEVSTDLATWTPRPDLLLPSADQTAVAPGFIRMQATIDPIGERLFFRIRAAFR